MESKADTRLVMISSLRAKVEFQRSGPQPLVGTSQRFPSKAMVTCREREEVDRGGHAPQGVAHVLGARPPPPPPRSLAPDPRAISASQMGPNQGLAFSSPEVSYAGWSRGPGRPAHPAARMRPLRMWAEMAG